MTDLEQARSVEAGRFKKVLQKLESLQELHLSRIDAEMARRGLEHSDARLQAIFEAGLERMNQSILQRIAIRKDMLRNYPELGSATELNHLAEAIQADLTSLRGECRKHGLIVPPEVFAELRARARESIETLKRETVPPVRARSKTSSFSPISPDHAAAKIEPGPTIQAGGFRSVPRNVGRSTPAVSAPAIGSFDAVCRKVDEVIDDLNGRNQKLADSLRHLAAAIKQSIRPADDRAVYLEQLQFLAEQAARAAVLRRISVVKGIVIALHFELGDLPSVAPALQTAGPLLAAHFGIKEVPV